MPVSGLSGIQEIPLGSRLCMFYRQLRQVLPVMASLLQTNLINRELLVWMSSAPWDLSSQSMSCVLTAR